ncbi:transposase, partial [Escherichia coli]|nr:transposase [Escherichia coli]
QWPALTYYANDGWVEIDNNIAENALRAVSLGRKNFLFFGSDHGGERGALLYCNQVNHLIPTRVLVKGGEITCKILK